MNLSIWKDGNNQVKLVQLSDEAEDGTVAEQITHLKTLSAYSGFECVSQSYEGTFPDSDSSLWEWDGNSITISKSHKVQALKEELNNLEAKELMPRGARETEILAIPLLTLLLSTLTAGQKTAMESIKNQLIAGNPHYKNLIEIDAIATAKRKDIKDLS